MRFSALPLIGVSLLQVSLGGPEQSLSGGMVSTRAGAAQERGTRICCAWGRPLDDGELTVAFTPGDPGAIDVMRAAVQAWDTALPELALRETPPDQSADITISHAAPSGQTRGTAVASYDRGGLIRRVRIVLYGAPTPANAGALGQVTKHELGHALGLDHSGSAGDLMFPLVDPRLAPIPPCSLTAVREANRWRLLELSSEPRRAVRQVVPCGAPVPTRSDRG
jgi:hypothetical protein